MPMTRDIRLALRALSRAPGFTATTVLTLAIGLGGAAAVGALAQAVARPLPYPAPDRLVAVWEFRAGERRSVAPANYLDWRRRTRSFEELAAADARSGSITVGGVAERGRVAVVSGNLFEVLGVDPVLGRAFDPTLDPRFPDLEAVVSHAAWMGSFGGASDVVGRTFKLDEVTYQIVGVAPASVAYPEPDLFAWVRSRTEAPEIAGFPSLQSLTEMRDAWYFQVVGRLRAGEDQASAQVEMSGIAGELEARYPESNTGHGALVVPLSEDTVAGMDTILVVLALSVMLVLLAAGVNVVHLVLARSRARAPETAVRVALGARDSDLIRPFMAEGAVLGLAGGVTGLLIAGLALRFGAAALGEVVPTGGGATTGPAISVLVLLMGALAGIVVSALGFSASPRRGPSAQGLREAQAGSRRSHQGIVIAQVAAAIALLGGAAVLGRSVTNLAAVEPGFDVTDLITLQIALPDARTRPYPGRVDAYESLSATLSALPGVTSVGYGSTGPLTMGPQANVRTLEGAGDDGPNAGWQPVAPGFFEALGMVMVHGRAFDHQDTEGALDVGVVNEALARELYGGRDPLGRQVTIGLDGHDRPITIVGVVSDTRTRGPARPPGPVLYRPVRQTTRYSAAAMFFAVRGGEGIVSPAGIRTALRQAAPAQPFFALARGDDLTRPFRRSQTTLLGILGLFATTSLLLGIVGTYGVTSHTVTRRRREIGVRMALGANQTRIVGEVVGKGMRSFLLGLPLGIAIAYALGRTLAGILFDVPSFHVPTIALACSIVLVATAGALFLPALSASRTDPASATRAD